MKKVFTLLFDGYADWELGFVLAELRRIGQLEVTTLGFSKEPVLSMGGLRVLPDKELSDFNIDEAALFILPGGQLWEGDYPKEVVHDCLSKLVKANVPVASICAATTVFAKAGLLKGKKHTSNSPLYMKKKVPDFNSENLYVDELAVGSQGVITASGLGAVEFTKVILDELEIATPEMRAFWYDAFKNGNFPDEMID